MDEDRSQKAREWSAIFLEWRKSGESQRGYCRRTGLSISAFVYWYRKLEKDGAEQLFVKVRNVPALAGLDGNRLTARAGGGSAELFGRESATQLTSVFRALKAIS